MQTVKGLFFSLFMISATVYSQMTVAETAAVLIDSSAPANAAVLDKAVASMDDFIAKNNIDTLAANWKTQLPKPPQLEVEPGKNYFWQLTTSKGDIRIKLMPKIAPMHVSSTIYLTRLGFYDGTVFHRVIQGFMAQGGDPLGTGRGEPGYRYDGEFHRYIKHYKGGILSMANAGPGTDGSQFFLTFVATPHLDGKHTIFGEIVEGMDTLRQLERRGSRSGATMEKLTLVKATIVAE